MTDSNILNQILDEMIEYLLKLWGELPDYMRGQTNVATAWRALLALLQGMRASGLGSAAQFRQILAALKAFIEALARAGGGRPGHLLRWIGALEEEIATLEAASAGVVATAVILWILAILAIIKSIYEIRRMYGLADTPVGGPPCGTVNPVKRGMTATGWSFWGEGRAFEDAEANARASAQTETCTGSCTSATTTCRGNCAILDVSYHWRGLWTRCDVAYDEYCECY